MDKLALAELETYAPTSGRFRREWTRDHDTNNNTATAVATTTVTKHDINTT